MNVINIVNVYLYLYSIISDEIKKKVEIKKNLVDYACENILNILERKVHVHYVIIIIKNQHGMKHGAKHIIQGGKSQWIPHTSCSEYIPNCYLLMTKVKGCNIHVPTIHAFYSTL